MAPRYRDPDDLDTPETDGGEAGPRPLKSRRLVDMMEPSKKGKGRGKDVTGLSIPPEEAVPAPVGKPRQPHPAVRGTAPRQELSDQTPSGRKASSKTTAKAPTDHPTLSLSL